MPRIRKPEAYPEQYHDLVRQVGLQGVTIRVPQEGPMPDSDNYTGEQRLLKLRQHFYAFIGALKRPDADPKWSELATAAAQTVVYYDKKQVALVFSNRADAWQGKLLDEFAGPVGKDAIPTKGADDSMAAVLAKLAEDAP